MDGFVAHEDIEPTQQWHQEIENALRSMHVLVAVITEGFVSSKWTDQEVGFALGRGVLVIPVRYGADPYGLVGKYQGVPAPLDDLPGIAMAIFETVAKQDHLRSILADAVVDSVCSQTRFADVIERMKTLQRVRSSLTAKHARALLYALRNNSAISGAYGVPDIIKTIATELNVPIVAPTSPALEEPSGCRSSPR